MEGNEWKIFTNMGHYEYLVKPYGLVNTPSVFWYFVNEHITQVIKKTENNLYVSSWRNVNLTKPQCHPR